jgi:hypothetical protein
MRVKQIEENIKLKHNFMNEIMRSAGQENSHKMILHRRRQTT